MLEIRFGKKTLEIDRKDIAMFGLGFLCAKIGKAIYDACKQEIIKRSTRGYFISSHAGVFCLDRLSYKNTQHYGTDAELDAIIRKYPNRRERESDLRKGDIVIFSEIKTAYTVSK